MEGGFGVLADKLIQFGIALDIRAGAQLATAIRVQRRLRHDFPGDSDAVAEFLPVLLAGHVIEQNARVLARVPRTGMYAAAAGRAHGADVGLEAVLLYRVAAVVVNRHRQEVVLDVRPFELGTRTNETAGLELVARADTLAEEQPLGADQRLVVHLQRGVERDRLFAGVLQVHLQVVLQVGADARKLVNDRDAEFAQQRPRAHARALQDLRRGDGAAAEQHFAAGVDGHWCVAGAVQVGRADGPLAAEQDAIGQCVGHDGQVRSATGHVQIAARGAGAPAVGGDRAVHRAEAFLAIAVEVVGFRITGLHAGLDHGAEQGVVAGLGSAHAHRTVTAVVVVGADVAGFGLAEVGQAVEVAPVFQARRLGPAVVVHGVATDVTHAVDQRGAAQALAATTFHAAVVHVRFGIGLVGPVIAPAL